VASTQASTSRSFGFSMKACIETPLPVSSRLICDAAAWSSASTARRTGVMNSDERRGPSSRLASSSARRLVESGSPIGMSIATTSNAPSVSPAATTSAMVAPK